MLLRKQGNTCLLLVGVIHGKVTKEISVEVPQNAKNISTIYLPHDLTVCSCFFYSQIILYSTLELIALPCSLLIFSQYPTNKKSLNVYLIISR